VETEESRNTTATTGIPMIRLIQIVIRVFGFVIILAPGAMFMGGLEHFEEGYTIQAWILVTSSLISSFFLSRNL